MKKAILYILCIALITAVSSGCSEKSGNSGTASLTELKSSSAEAAQVDFSKTDDDMFTERDLNPQYDDSSSGCIITLSGNNATAASDSVKISDGKITITEEATYIVSGTDYNGMIIVDADEKAKPQIVLNGVNIKSETSAAIYVLNADKVFLTLADGKNNTLENGGTFTAIDENNIDAVVFSKQDLTFNGTGNLTVNSPAGHGIVSKDDLVFAGGTYTVNSASHGVVANDSVSITGETSLTAFAGKDGIHAENSDDSALGFVYISNGNINIESEGDGIDSGSYIQIENGNFKLLNGGGSENGTKKSSDTFGSFKGGRPGKAADESSSVATDDSSTSMKGIKAGNSMLINNGTFNINSADDGVHSNLSVTVNGGKFDIATGDDGIHADKALTITKGDINIAESYEGLEALNIDIKGGDIKIISTDDGINAAGGTDASGITGGRDGMFGNAGGKPQNSGGMSSSNGSIKISGGNIYVKMSGDGFDANGSLEITGGSIVISGANSGDTSILDFDSSGIISGGTFIGTGAVGMAQNFSSDSTQGAIMVSSSGSDGTVIKLTDSSGKVIVSHTANQDFSCIIISCDEILKGNSYRLTVGSSTQSITMNSTVYGSGNGGFGGPKGFGGR